MTLTRATGPAPWYEARPWQTNAVLLLLGGLLFALTRQLISEYQSFTIGYSGVSGWSAIVFLAACLIILTCPTDRYTFAIILTVAIACRLVTLFPEPGMSSDVYRYAWDGVVQHAHINPYRYVPGDAALKFLREPNQDLFDSMNRRDYARTIYPPAAQVLFYLITFISPTMTCMKTIMVFFEGLTVYALLELMKHMGIRREQALLYAWCPLLIWEIGGSGHLDSAAMAYMALALLFRYRRRPVLTGVFLGLAVLTKLYPLVLLPALMLPRKPADGEGEPASSWEILKPAAWDWTMPATVLTMAVVGYSAYSSVGRLVFGFLTGYAQEEGLKSGARFFLLELAQHVPGFTHLPTGAFYVFAALVFAALTVWSLRVARAQDRAAFLTPAMGLAVALMLLFSPHYPWYIIWLLLFFTLRPSLALLTYLMGFFYLFTTELADPGPKMYLLNKYLYGAVLIACIIEAALRTGRMQRWFRTRSAGRRAGSVPSDQPLHEATP